MSKPLTEEQKATIIATTVVFNSEAEAIEAALARLDFLERKVQAAEVLADEVRVGYGLRAAQFAIAYHAVTE